MYRFTQNGRSLSTGISWKGGDRVPPGLPITEFMLNAGVVEKVDPQPYKEMTFNELADELRKRELKISGDKQEKIDRLYRNDNKD